jgi:predicted dehydrogenase
LVFGTPDAVAASGVLGTTGVDETVAAILHYPSGRMGVVKAATRLAMRSNARISASEGSIEIPAYMHCPDHITVTSPRGVQRIEAAFGTGGFRFEIAEVHRCIRQGLRESCDMPLQESIAIARTMDEIRNQIGMRYPDE